MKVKSKELDVDYMGGQGPLTREEERKISAYLKGQKLLRTKTLRQTAKGVSKRIKATA
mgnify:CR=1 FL=1